MPSSLLLPAEATLTRHSCAMSLMSCETCRLLAPVLRTGHFWELFLITPSFLLTAPWWLAGTTYLAALTAGAVPGILLLIISELRLIFRGQSYIESLQVTPPELRHMLNACVSVCISMSLSLSEDGA